MISGLNIGDFLYTAEWEPRYHSTYTRKVIIRKWEIVKLTPAGYHVKLKFTSYGKFIEDGDEDKEKQKGLFICAYQNFPVDSTKWVGHNSRIYFETQKGAVARLIMRRERYIKRLENSLRQAKQDIASLKKGELSISNNNIEFKSLESIVEALKAAP